jgi:ribosomal protein L32
LKVCPNCGAYQLTLLQKLYTGQVYAAECDKCGQFARYDKLIEDTEYKKKQEPSDLT